MEANLNRLNPEARTIIEKASASGGKAYYEIPLEEARKLSDQRSLEWAGKFDFNGHIEDILIPSENVKGGIPAIVYRPNKMRDNPPLMVYFHGGGMVVGSAAGKTVTCQIIAQKCRCIIVNVDYRLAPEHKFPCMMEDGQEAVEWVIENKCTIGGTAESLIGVFGDSAGGTITACLGHDIKGIDFQILVYPRIVNGKSLPSYKQFGTGLGLTDTLMDWFWEQMLSREEDATDPRLVACLRPSFHEVPPALFIVAECDPIRDDSYVYMGQLVSATVPADILVIEGALHGFFTYPGVCKTSCERAYGAINKFVDRMCD